MPFIVVPAGTDHGYLRRERHNDVPFVFLGRPPRFLDADAVISDNAGGARAATAHLIAAGHRRIAFLGGREPIYTARERRRGYLAALREHGIPGEYLGYLPGRVNLAKYKPKLVWSSRPRSVCEAVASAVGIADIYAVSLRPELASAMTRLGQLDYEDVGVEQRARVALYAAGVDGFRRAAGAARNQHCPSLRRRRAGWVSDGDADHGRRRERLAERS